MNANAWAYLEEKQLKGPSWYSGCHISHINEHWSIKQLIHTVCLCRPQKNSWASRTITCTLLPSCPQHMVQGTDTKSREGQPKDSRALETNLESCFIEQGDSGHVLCSLTSNINNPVTGWWYLWSFRRRTRRMTPPGRKVQAFQGIDTWHEVPSKEIPLQKPIRNLCLSLGKGKQLGRLRKVKKVLSFLYIDRYSWYKTPKWIKKAFVNKCGPEIRGGF